MPVDLVSFIAISSFYILIWLVILRAVPLDWLTVGGLVVFMLSGMVSSIQSEGIEHERRTRKEIDAH